VCYHRFRNSMWTEVYHKYWCNLDMMSKAARSRGDIKRGKSVKSRIEAMLAARTRQCVYIAVA
jgi:hypothetical protein